MATIAPWLLPARPNESQEAGSAAGARLRQIREQAADSLRRHQASMAAIAQRGAAERQQAGLQAQALRSREGMAQQEAALAGEKLREDARQADLMDAFNRAKLEKMAKTKNYQFMNTAAGPVRVDPVTGEWEAIPMEDQNSAVQDLIKRSQAGQQQPAATPPAAEALQGGSPWFWPFKFGWPGQNAGLGTNQAPATNEPPPMRLLSTNQPPAIGQQPRPVATEVDDMDPLGLGIGQ